MLFMLITTKFYWHHVISTSSRYLITHLGFRSEVLLLSKIISPEEHNYGHIKATNKWNYRLHYLHTLYQFAAGNNLKVESRNIISMFIGKIVQKRGLIEVTYSNTLSVKKFPIVDGSGTSFRYKSPLALDYGHILPLHDVRLDSHCCSSHHAASSCS